eukprot:3103400-Pleurochrysis_carterae.AAC.2
MELRPHDVPLRIKLGATSVSQFRSSTQYTGTIFTRVHAVIRALFHCATLELLALVAPLRCSSVSWRRFARLALRQEGKLYDAVAQLEEALAQASLAGTPPGLDGAPGAQDATSRGRALSSTSIWSPDFALSSPPWRLHSRLLPFAPRSHSRLFHKPFLLSLASLEFRHSMPSSPLLSVHIRNLSVHRSRRSYEYLQPVV